MPHVYLKLVSLLLVTVALSACGTKGPLYIPEQAYPPAASQ